VCWITKRIYSLLCVSKWDGRYGHGFCHGHLVLVIMPCVRRIETPKSTREFPS
jgi:hypothetical protein